MTTTDVSLYLRQSYDPNGEGVAVARQRTECEDYARAHGLRIVEEFPDNDTSATTGKRRPGFEAALAAGRDILVWHQDRLLRVSKDLERVLDAKVNVFTVKAGTLDLATPTGRAVARTVAAWSTFEGEHKSERQRASNRQRAVAGTAWWSTTPFGFNDDGTLNADAALIRKAYEDLLGGRTLADITRDWNEAGALSPRGKPWIRTSVLQVVKNARNAGLRLYQGEVVARGQWEAIVDEGTFYAVQAVLADPERGKGGGARRNLLTGIAECGLCGKRMVACQNGAAKYRFRGYRCPTGHLSMRADLLEAWVTEVASAPVAHVQTSDGPQFRRHATTPAMARLSAEAEALRTRRDEAAAAYASGAIPLAVLTQASADIERRLAENLAALMVETSKPQVYVSPAGKTFEQMTPAEQHEHVRQTLTVLVKPIPRYTRRQRDSVDIEPR